MSQEEEVESGKEVMAEVRRRGLAGRSSAVGFTGRWMGVIKMALGQYG